MSLNIEDQLDFIGDWVRRFQRLDPFIQAGVLLAVLSFLGQGSLIVVFIGVLVLIWAVQKGVVPGNFIGFHKPQLQEGDAKTLTPAILETELQEIDPLSAYKNIYSQPEIFHLIHQSIYLKEISPGSFERLLYSVDRYAELAYKIKYVKNSVDPVSALSEAITRSTSILNNYESIIFDAPISTNTGLKQKFLDTLESLRIVLRRDLTVLERVCKELITLDEDLHPSLAHSEDPRAPDVWMDIDKFGSQYALF